MLHWLWQWDSVTTGERRVCSRTWDYDSVLTTWLSVITRSRVSQQDLTAPRGNVPNSSFSRPNTWRVVVSSLLPGGRPQNGVNCHQRYKQLCISVASTLAAPPACSISLAQNLAVVAAAGWWVGALSLNRKSLPLRMAQMPCCAALRTWRQNTSVSMRCCARRVIHSLTLFESRPLVCCALWSWEGHDRPGE